MPQSHLLTVLPLKYNVINIQRSANYSFLKYLSIDLKTTHHRENHDFLEKSTEV